MQRSLAKGRRMVFHKGYLLHTQALAFNLGTSPFGLSNEMKLSWVLGFFVLSGKWVLTQEMWVAQARGSGEGYRESDTDMACTHSCHPQMLIHTTPTFMHKGAKIHEHVTQI